MKLFTHWYLRMQVAWQNEARPIGISGCRWYRRIKILSHWYLGMHVAWQNEAVDPLVSQDAGVAE
jgi:hypothetical protein